MEESEEEVNRFYENYHEQYLINLSFYSLRNNLKVNLN